jgi:hypothetical protein
MSGTFCETFAFLMIEVALFTKKVNLLVNFFDENFRRFSTAVRVQFTEQTLQMSFLQKSAIGLPSICQVVNGMRSFHLHGFFPRCYVFCRDKKSTAEVEHMLMIFIKIKYSQQREAEMSRIGIAQRHFTKALR